MSDKAKFTKGNRSAETIGQKQDSPRKGEKAKFTATDTITDFGGGIHEDHGPSFPKDHGGERAAGTEHHE